MIKPFGVHTLQLFEYVYVRTYATIFGTEYLLNDVVIS